MIFTKTKLKGVYVVEVQTMEDERGFFGRSFCQHEFENMGIDYNIVQSNISYNKTKGTLRGLHSQVSPYREAKLVRCSRGSIFDVVVDLRKTSGTYLQWVSEILTEDNYKMMYVPEGFAHGFITLEDNVEVVYQMSEFYTPGSEVGFCWNDPAFNIQWPIEPSVMSLKDKSYSLFDIEALVSSAK